MAFCELYLVLRDTWAPQAGAGYGDEIGWEMGLQAAHGLGWRGVWKVGCRRKREYHGMERGVIENKACL